MKKLTAAIVTLVAAPALASCGNSSAPATAPEASTSKPVYEGVTLTYPSLTDLCEHSDLVVRGHIDGVLAHWQDHGGDPENAALPLVIYNFVVDQYYSQKPGPNTIPVVWVDHEAGQFDASDLAKSDGLVIYLYPGPTEGGSELPEGIEDVWVPTSADNSVLDVRGDRAVARSATLTSIEPDPKYDGDGMGKPLDVSLKDLESNTRSCGA